tara:strand:+ start:3191 stop:3382 length:192 start_codon:yes stop_codon:yes gene_type:complete
MIGIITAIDTLSIKLPWHLIARANSSSPPDSKEIFFSRLNLTTLNIKILFQITKKATHNKKPI